MRKSESVFTGICRVLVLSLFYCDAHRTYVGCAGTSTKGGATSRQAVRENECGATACIGRIGAVENGREWADKSCPSAQRREKISLGQDMHIVERHVRRSARMLSWLLWHLMWVGSGMPQSTGRVVQAVAANGRTADRGGRNGPQGCSESVPQGCQWRRQSA
jgi:hypothetical protein